MKEILPDERSLQAILTAPVVWLLMLAGAVIFALILRHERRQARRLSERSKELEHLSSELIRVNRMKSEFLANVSHELRTPLNAIVGFADLLSEGIYGELTSRQMKPIERIEASATHLRHLVDQILDLAKMAAGRVELQSDAIDLSAFILDVVSEVESLMSEKNLAASIAVSSTLPRIHTDPNHLRQILVNLIGNAVKYTDHGSVTVRARLATDGELSHLPGAVAFLGTKKAGATWVAIQVIDTGHGIAASDQNRIFEEFEQVNSGSRGDSSARGTGLGLAISRRLSHLLGGEITVRSELGKGSTFTLWIPSDSALGLPSQNTLNA